jgi:hypothetical protein
MSNLTRFNNQVDSLIGVLKNIESIKNDSAIQLFELKLNAARKANVKIPIENFIKNVYQYKDHIMQKDEEFFLGNIDQRVKEIEVEEQDSEKVLHQALNIKDHWKNDLTDENKEVIWKYFQVLIKLAERYITEKVGLAVQ